MTESQKSEVGLKNMTQENKHFFILSHMGRGPNTFSNFVQVDLVALD